MHFLTILQCFGGINVTIALSEICVTFALMKKSFSEILQDEEAARRRKVAVKLPSWSVSDGLEFPSSLCLEQCSSELAAFHKASLLEGGRNGHALRVADLTGGLGVDSWAFSKVASAVLHNERSESLSAAAEANAVRLDARNIVFSRYEIAPFDACSAAPVPEWFGTLRDFRPDWVFLDPARRDGLGKKVFLLEDCSPDVLELLPALWNVAGHIMLKLSPMADVSMLVSRLGKELESVHIVGVDGEVKELLCILNREGNDAPEPVVVVSELSPGKEYEFSFKASEERGAQCPVVSELSVGQLILEPQPPLMKAGCFSLLGLRGGFLRLAGSTHLYSASRSAISDPAAGRMFKVHELLEVHPFGKAAFKELGSKYPQAEVSARNIPMTTDQLRSRLGVKPGGGVHIRGCTVGSSRKLLVTRRVDDLANPVGKE